MEQSGALVDLAYEGVGGKRAYSSEEYGDRSPVSVAPLWWDQRRTVGRESFSRTLVFISEGKRRGAAKPGRSVKPGGL